MRYAILPFSVWSQYTFKGKRAQYASTRVAAERLARRLTRAEGVADAAVVMDQDGEDAPKFFGSRRGYMAERAIMDWVS